MRSFVIGLFFAVTIAQPNLAQVATSPQPIMTTPKPPIFRIVAPSVICKPPSARDADDADVELPKQITISMQTPGGQRLSYRIQMYFEVMGGFRGQQHSLKLWDSVRRLEHRMNGRDRATITEMNQINVNNTELTSGVYYVFRIVGIDADGDESEPQNYTVTFSDGKLKRTNPDGSIIPDDVSFLLLGAPNTYADREYMVEAQPFFCRPRNDYLIRWSMVPALLPAGAADQHAFTDIPGSVLRIPSGQLRVGAIYTVDATLLRANDSQAIVFQSLKVFVLGRGFEARLIPDSSTIGIGSPAELQLRFTDGDATGLQPIAKWSCRTLETDEECTNFAMDASGGDFSRAVEFYSQGEYIVRAELTLGAETRTFVTVVSVNRDVIVRPSIRYVATGAHPAASGLIIETIVDNLVPNCYCEWTVAKPPANDTQDVDETSDVVEEYAYFNETEIPGGLGNLTVLDIEGNFLSELVDYENATISRDLRLHVPEHTLRPDVAYRFRLRSICPVPLTEDQLDSALTASRPNVTSSVDLVVRTNGAPRGHRLEIVPAAGRALSTRFKFTTGVAADEAADYPLKYRFLFVVPLLASAELNDTNNEITISVGEFYENTVTDSVLPFAGEGLLIRTAYEVCDSRQSCASIAGPNVTVHQLPADETANRVEQLQAQISAQMLRMEYDAGFRAALIVAVSLRNSGADDRERLAKFDRMMKDTMAEQIDRIERLLDAPEATDPYLSSTEVLNFVHQGKQLFDVLQYSASADDATDVGLRTRMVHMFDRTDTLNSELRLRKLRRKRRTIAADNDRLTSLADRIQARLDMAEAAAVAASAGDPAVVRQLQHNQTLRVHEYMEALCRAEPFATKSFVGRKRSVRFEVREVTARHLLNANGFDVPLWAAKIPGATVRFNKALQVPQQTGRLCVGKAWYAGDFVNGGLDQREIFEVTVIAVSAKKSSMLDLVAMPSKRFEIAIPFYSESESDRLHCEIWHEKSWQRSLCDAAVPPVRGQFVRCRCARLGFFRLAADFGETSTTSMADEGVDEPMLLPPDTEAIAVTAQMTTESTLDTDATTEALLNTTADGITLGDTEAMQAIAVTAQMTTESTLDTDATTQALLNTMADEITLGDTEAMQAIAVSVQMTTESTLDTEATALDTTSDGIFNTTLETDTATTEAALTPTTDSLTNQPNSATTQLATESVETLTTEDISTDNPTEKICSFTPYQLPEAAHTLSDPTTIPSTQTAASAAPITVESAVETINALTTDSNSPHPTVQRLRLRVDQDPSVGYAMAGGAIFIGFVLIGGLFVYHRWLKRPPQRAAAVPTSTVVANDPAGPTVRYARFYDEHVRGGEQERIETVFDGRT